MSDTPQPATTVEGLLSMMREYGAGAMAVVPSDAGGNPLFMVLVVEGREVERYKAKLAELDEEPSTSTAGSLRSDA